MAVGLPRRAPELASDRRLSMEGRTRYWFKDHGGAGGACCRTSFRVSVLGGRIVGWDWERRALSGRLDTGESGEAGGLRTVSASPGFTAGLLRPLEDFGRVKCIDNPLLTWNDVEFSRLFLGYF